MSSCKTCDNQTSIIETQSVITQKRIQNQVRIPSSMYTMNFAALNTVINNNNVGKKHDSYQRRLNKLKQRNIVENTLTDTETPLKGNKSKSYNIIPCLPDLESFLNDYETSRAYKCYNKLNNLPTTLTLGSGDTSYNFWWIYRRFNNRLHKTIILIMIQNQGVQICLKHICLVQQTKVTFFIDFEINTTINDLSTLDVNKLKLVNL